MKKIFSPLFFLIVICCQAGLAQRTPDTTLQPLSFFSDSSVDNSIRLEAAPSAQNDKVQLQWSVNDSYINNCFFAVERSGDGNNFEIIDVVKVDQDKKKFEF